MGNYNLSGIYGVDNDVISCLKCGGTDLKTNLIKIRISSNGNAMTWYCEKCEIVWVKGLRQPKFQK